MYSSSLFDAGSLTRFDHGYVLCSCCLDSVSFVSMLLISHTDEATSLFPLRLGSRRQYHQARKDTPKSPPKRSFNKKKKDKEVAALPAQNESDDTDTHLQQRVTASDLDMKVSTQLHLQKQEGAQTPGHQDNFHAGSKPHPNLVSVRKASDNHVSVSAATTLKSGLVFSDVGKPAGSEATDLATMEQLLGSTSIQQLDFLGSTNIVYLQHIPSVGWGVLVSTGGVMLLLHNGARLCLMADASQLEYLSPAGDITRCSLEQALPPHIRQDLLILASFVQTVREFRSAD
eukprot:m.131709 g.131709  ORF g.131709 m.131709 type:complete len:287 (-) comp15753_c0_seq1:76-936(-)